MKKIKVIVVDDHSLIREGLTKLLELEKDIEVVGQASNGDEAIDLINSISPDVMLIDINMPVKNGFETMSALKNLEHGTKIIVITIHDRHEYLLEAIRLGAAGFVMKDAEVSSILEAIRTTFAGKTYIQPSISNTIIKEIDEKSFIEINAKMENDKLTRREIQVLLLIAEGKNNKEIANELFISEKTVKNHVSSIFKKIKVSDRTQAAIYAFKQHLV